MFSALFAPGRIGSMRVKNRIIMAAVATNFASDQGGVTQRLVDFYAERARGGVGTVIVENANVDFPAGTNGATQLRIDEDKFIPGLSYLAEAIQRGGARAVLQVSHGGPTSKSAKTGGLQPVGPSAVGWPPLGETPRPLSAHEIDDIAIKFALAAARAKKAGFDAVEFHGGHSYLLSSFISPYTNRREDEFGGSLENRMRFPLMVVRRAREMVGSDFPLFFRYSADEFLEGGLALDEGAAVAAMLEAAGVDLISVSSGGRSSVCQMIEPMSYDEGWRIYLAATVKRKVHVPVATCGNIKTPYVAEKALVSGQADFVALARALIADPYWADKAFRGQGESINRCISCNVGCTERRVFKDLPIACAVNPRVGWEGQVVRPPEAKKRVLVVGGGPAGLEATATLRERGHEVLLVEKERRLGGQLRLAAALRSKEKLSWYLDYVEGRVKRSGAEVRLGVAADRALLQSYSPDVVILATGSKPIQPFAPSEQVMAAREVFASERSFAGKRIAVVGGGSVGCECAEYLAEAGGDVTVVEMTDDLAADMDFVSRLDLLDRIGKLGVKAITGCKVREVNAGTVVGERGGETVRIEVDLVAVAMGARPDVDLEEVLRELNIMDYRVVGDADRPAKLIAATLQARAAAESI